MSQSTLIRPASTYSFVNRFSAYSKPRRPFDDGKRDSVFREISVVSFVAVLLNTSRPAAIARFVIAVIVNAINAVLVRWSITHICKKVGKRSSPAFAHNYSATAVFGVCLVCLAMASSTHATPYVPYFSVSHRMGSLECASVIYLEASTAFHVSTIENCNLSQNRLTAFTSAKPKRSVRLVSSTPFFDFKSSELFATDIRSLLGESRKDDRFGRISDSHEMFLSKKVRLWLEPVSATTLDRLVSLYQIPKGAGI